uniref:Uncharacterized protein n=1 Tax=Tetranychus urticae TaxID=32264 RepID=T1KT75_TETUR
MKLIRPNITFIKKLISKDRLGSIKARSRIEVLPNDPRIGSILKNSDLVCKHDFLELLNFN